MQMEESVEAYVWTLAHTLVQEAVLCQDFTVVFSINFGDSVTARIDVLPGIQEKERPSSSKHREKAKRYRRMLKSKEEEIDRLKEEIRRMQNLPVEHARPDTPLSSSTEKTYKINFSRSQSPAGESLKPQTVFSRKSSWERTTQTENQAALVKAVSRHLNTPSLVDDNFQVASQKKHRPKKKHRVLMLEDDSSSDESKPTPPPAPLSLPFEIAPLVLPPLVSPQHTHAATDTDFLETGHFPRSEISTQTEEVKTVIEIPEESESVDVVVQTEMTSEPTPVAEQKHAANPHTHALPDIKPKKKPITTKKVEPEKSNVVVNITVSTALPPANKLRKVEKTKRTRKKKTQSSKEKPSDRRPKSEAAQTRITPQQVPVTFSHVPTLSISTKSSKSGSDRQNRSLRSTVPSFSELEDPAVRQNLLHYLRTHNVDDLRPATVQAARYYPGPRKRNVKPEPRPRTPITELLYTELYSDKDSWKNVVQVLRENPALLSKFINTPLQAEESVALPTAQKESSNASLNTSQEQRSSSAAARLAVLSRNGRRYRVMDYTTPISEIPSLQPPSRESPESNRASPNQSRNSSRRPVSRVQAKTVKDWSMSPLDEEVSQGHYNFNWQKDVNLMNKPEIVSILKQLEDGRESLDILSLHRRASKTRHKLQSDMFLSDSFPSITAPSTAPGTISLLQDCLRLLRMRQLTISVLHYLHQREEAMLNVLSESKEDEAREGQVQQISKLMKKALREWKDAFTPMKEFVYLGKDFGQEGDGESYLEGRIRLEDLKH